MRYFVLFLLLLAARISKAQSPVESPSTEPIPNVRTSSETPKPEKEESQSSKKIGPGTSRPDNPNYKRDPSSKTNQAPNPLDTPKDTLKPGTLYSPRE